MHIVSDSRADAEDIPGFGDREARFVFTIVSGRRATCQTSSGPPAAPSIPQKKESNMRCDMSVVKTWPLNKFPPAFLIHWVFNFQQLHRVR